MSRKIVQFGTSRFLQAHADLMLSEARDAGQDVGEITIVETTGSPASRARVSAFADGKPFPVRIRGLENGVARDETRWVGGVVAGLSARHDLEGLRAVFCDADIVLSNTGDTGYSLPPNPKPALDDWTCFPELLTALLRDRFERGGGPVTILPCELISGNGDVLRRTVLDLAAMVLAEEPGEEPGQEAFVRWIEANCLFVNTLVDRIVSAPIDPIGAVAEPYALWAMEERPGFVPPCVHDQIVVVPDLGPIERKKLFILNLAHTLLAQRWLKTGGRDDMTVREAMADPEVRAWLDGIMTSDVVPAFPADDDAPDYWRQCKERFANPFLDHRLADIATNHTAKIERRVKGFLDWAGNQPGVPAPEKLRAAFGEDQAKDRIEHS